MKKILAFLLFFFSLIVTLPQETCAQLNKPYFFYRGRQLIVEGNYRDAIEMLNLLLRTETKEYEGYFLRGVAKYNLDDLLGAEADFTRAIEENPVYTMAFQYRAITRSRMGQYEEALQDYEWAEELRPNVAAIFFSRGVTYFLSQQFDKAIEDFNRYLRTEPRDVNALTNRGTSYLFLKDTVQAYADYNRAIEVSPMSPEGYMRRGLLEVSQSKNEEGIADLSRAIQLDSGMAVAYFYRSIAYANESRPMLALADLDEAISIDSTNSVTFFNRAILRSQIGDYNRAIQDYDRVALYNPGNVLVFYNRAAVKAHIGDLRGAAEDYSRAIELYPDFANAYLFRSQLRAAMQDFRGADADRRTAESKINEYRSKLSDSTFSAYADTSRQFDRLMAFDADFGNDELRNMRGDVQDDIRLLPLFRITIIARDSASARYERPAYRNARLDVYLEQFAGNSFPLGISNVRPANPAYADSLRVWDTENLTPVTWQENFVKGITQALMNQYASAISYYRRSARLDSANPFVYINRSVAQTEMIQFIASLEDNNSLHQITISNDDPATRLLNSSAGSQRRQYDFSEAVGDMMRAAELMPELPHVYYNLGNLLYLSGDMPGAIEQYTRAIELYPDFAEAYYNRGMVQIRLRDTQKGCLDLSKAGELGLEEAYEAVRRFCGRRN